MYRVSIFAIVVLNSVLFLHPGLELGMFLEEATFSGHK